jgi:protein-S-isoprenylcysteine O-methyltransferase Ste14
MLARIQPFFQAAFLLGFFAATLFLPAGTLAWPMGWAFFAAFAAFMLAAFVLLDPELIQKRGSVSSTIKRWDVALASSAFVFLYPLNFAVAALDAVRFGWSPPLAFAVKVAGLAGFVLGYGFAFWAMRVNRFFSTFVEIQADRGHRVVAVGPYRYVRHPGYAGAIIAHIAVPFSLGSLWAVLPALSGAFLFAVRTHLEDKTLKRELEGYSEYTSRVRYRLLPGIW